MDAKVNGDAFDSNLPGNVCWPFVATMCTCQAMFVGLLLRQCVPAIRQVIAKVGKFRAAVCTGGHS